MACSGGKKENVVSFSSSSLDTVVDNLIESGEPFDFYKEVYENFRFELKTTFVQKEGEETPPVESLTIYESNDEDESRFYKKSVEPISEVEWIEKEGKDYIRYDDSKHFNRTSYNPEFDQWKKGIFLDIREVFDLKALQKEDAASEKNQWSCYATAEQKICMDSKTGLPVFGKAAKTIGNQPVIMVFSVSYGDEFSVKKPKESEVSQPVAPKKEAKAAKKEPAKKKALQKKK